MPQEVRFGNSYQDLVLAVVTTRIGRAQPAFSEAMHGGIFGIASRARAPPAAARCRHARTVPGGFQTLEVLSITWTSSKDTVASRSRP
jgi:hypothetical protein